MEQQENSRSEGKNLMENVTDAFDGPHTLQAIVTPFKQLEGSAQLKEFRTNSLNELTLVPSLNSKNEDFKYTNFQSHLKPLVPLDANVKFDGVHPLSSYSQKCVFINGEFSASLSNLESHYVKVTNSSQNICEQFFAKKNIAEGGNSGLKLMSDITFKQLLEISLPENAELELEIIHIVCDNNDNNSKNHLPYVAPRAIVNVENGAKLKIVEQFLGLKEEAYFSNHLIEFKVSTDANVEHILVQRAGKNAIHGSTIYVDQSEKSNFKTVSLNFGSKISRNEIYPSIQGPSSEAWLIGANVISNDQTVDNFTVIDHVGPNCESHELYKGLYGGTSKGVFSGTIIVRKEAQKTNAYQSNSSLLCSENSESNSRPQLKIWADDVKCSHGATVGQLDEDALFYLMARGIPQSMARIILTRAYVSEAFSHISDPLLKTNVEAILEEKLNELL